MIWLLRYIITQKIQHDNKMNVINILSVITFMQTLKLRNSNKLQGNALLNYTIAKPVQL